MKQGSMWVSMLDMVILKKEIGFMFHLLELYERVGSH